MEDGDLGPAGELAPPIGLGAAIDHAVQPDRDPERCRAGGGGRGGNAQHATAEVGDGALGGAGWFDDVVIEAEEGRLPSEPVDEERARHPSRRRLRVVEVARLAGGAEAEHAPVVGGLEPGEDLEWMGAGVERPEAELHLGVDPAGDPHDDVPGVVDGGLVDDPGERGQEAVVGTAVAAPADGWGGHAEHLSTTVVGEAIRGSQGRQHRTRGVTATGAR